VKLKVFLPTEVFLDEKVNKVVAEAENGSFCLLPRHIDIVTALRPSLLMYETEAGDEVFLGVDGGVLTKVGEEVLVSTRGAVRGLDLGRLRDTIDERFRMLNEKEKSARSALAKLEGDFVRRFIEYQEHGR